MKQPDTLSTLQAAELCGVGRSTMLRWVKAGLIPSFTTGGGHRRMLRNDLLGFMHERGMPVEEGGPRIAVVDDDPNHVAALCRLIELHLPEAEVRTAFDGFRGGMLVTEFKPDLLFLDYMMPGVNGVEVCRTIRATPALSETRIVVVSGHVNDELERELRAIGAEQVLSKPIRPELILAELERFLPAVKRMEVMR